MKGIARAKEANDCNRGSIPRFCRNNPLTGATMARNEPPSVKRNTRSPQGAINWSTGSAKEKRRAVPSALPMDPLWLLCHPSGPVFCFNKGHPTREIPQRDLVSSIYCFTIVLVRERFRCGIRLRSSRNLQIRMRGRSVANRTNNE